MYEQEIAVRTDDGELTVFVVHPEGDGLFPVALLFMDGVGYREQVRENARRFAADGYYCLAPDLFYRLGPRLTFDMERIAGEGLDGPEGQRLMQAIGSVTPAGVVEDTRAVLAMTESDLVVSRGPKVCVGYCMGARVAQHVAAAFPDEFVAIAGIHPSALVTDAPDSPHLDLASLHAELYIAFAEIDRTATPELVDRFREEVERQGVAGVVERLPGVAHGFAMADLPVYDRDACERHFERTLDLWRRSLEGQPARA